MEPNTAIATTTTAQVSQSSSSETNKKRNNHRRRNNNKNKTRPAAAEEASTSQATKQPKKKEPLRGFKNPPKLEEEDQNEEADADVCFICTRPIDYYSVAPCDHRTCHLCTLRLRVLYKTKNCAYCKAEAAKVVFTNNNEKPYEDYKRDDTPFYDKKHGIRFETQDMYKDTMILLQHNCPEPDCEDAFESWSELKRHVKQTHDRLCCDLCLRNKKIFSHEHTLYTNAQLQKHHREGDASFNKDDETGFMGHPECVFCRTRFYGADELFEHCRDKHEQCHLCVRRGIQHQYYANYDSLEKHFKKEHFLCQYKECLDNKFVVFESDIDLKAHEVKEHGNSLSRHQRAKQSRVDVNLSYSSGQQQQQQRNNSHGRQKNSSQVGLSAEDFPDINGSTNTSALLSSRLASTSLSEQWPTLGEDISNSGRSSPGQSSSANESDTGIVSRHAAALDRVADVFKNVEKVIKFRQLTAGFTSLSTDADTYVNSIFELCDKNADLTAKVLTGAKDLVDNRTLRSEMVRIWNHKKDPAGSGSDTPRVLEINPTSNQTRRLQAKKKLGVWDKVASAAVDAGAIRSTFPPIQSKTPWSGTSTPRTNSESDLQQVFPALPSSASSASRRADFNSMLRKTNRNAWGETSANDSEYSDANTDDTNASNNRKGKKGKKGKQILFRVGL